METVLRFGSFDGVPFSSTWSFVCYSLYYSSVEPWRQVESCKNYINMFFFHNQPTIFNESAFFFLHFGYLKNKKEEKE